MLGDLTITSLGYFAIHDPGPPPSEFSCMSPQNAHSFWVPCAVDAISPAVVSAVESEITANALDGNSVTLSTIQISSIFLHATSAPLLSTQIGQNVAATNTQSTLPSKHPATTLLSSKTGSKTTQTGPATVSGDTQSSPTTATTIATNNFHPSGVSEGAKAGIVAGCILGAGILVAIVLCCIKRRRQRAESLEIGAAMAAATLSRATFDSYSIDRPSSGSNSRLFLSSSLAAHASPLSPPLSPPPRLGERRMLSLTSHGDSSHGSLTTRSSDEQLGTPGGYNTPQSQPTAAAAADTGRRPSLPTHGSQSISPAATSLPVQSWPLSAPPAILINSNNSNHSLRNFGGCSSPPPLSPLPRLPVSPPSSPQPTSPLALTVSPPASPRRTAAIPKTADGH